LGSAPHENTERPQRPTILKAVNSSVQRSGQPDDLRIRVVLADDFDDVRFLVRSILEASGRFDVVGEAANGRQAIDVVAKEQPDLLVLDLAMPVLSGLEAIPSIRRASPATRIVVLSGFSESLMAANVSNHIVGYVQKGATPSALVEDLLRAAGHSPL
jgi:DNA-binding NarL/FixJ family response regulator